MRTCFIVVALLLTSCASTTREPAPAEASLPGGTLWFSTTAPGQEPAQTAAEGELFLMLGVIPGSIGGDPSQPNLADVSIRVGTSTRVDLESFKPQVLEQIGRLDSNTMGEQFHADPSELRFGRISNLLGVKSDRTSYTSAGFHLPAKDVGVVLVYVDRPAMFSGSVIEDGTTIEYEARLPSQGFHWLGFYPQSNGVLKVRPMGNPVTRVEFRLEWTAELRPVLGAPGEQTPGAL